MVVHYTDKVGQWSKNKAIDIETKTMLWILAITLFVVATAAFLAGLTFHGGYFAVVAAIVIGIGYYNYKKLIQTMDRRFEASSKLRLQALRGGQAEAWVSMLIRQYVNDDWHLFDNVMLDANSDIDHVLIGPNGLYVISTKSHRGLFHATSEHDAFFNRTKNEWVKEVITQTMRLKEQLKVVESAKQPWVQAVLALPFAHIDAPPIPSKNGQVIPGNAVGPCWVLHEDTLTEAVAPVQIPRDQRMPKAEIARWVDALQKLQCRGR